MTVKAWNEAVAASKLERTAVYVKAFEAWENEFRAHPEQFMTDEQMAALDTLSLSE